MKSITSQHLQASPARALAACLTILVGCSGAIDGSESANPPPGAAGGAGRPGGGSGTGNAGGNGAQPVSGEGPQIAPPARLHRLSRVQYANALTDLFGDPAKLDDSVRLELDDQAYGFTNVGNGISTLSLDGSRAYSDAAFQVASKVMQSATSRARVMSCTPRDAQDKTCFATIIQSLGSKAWRRPLAAAEVDRYVSLGTAASAKLNDVQAGIEFVVAGLLQSPNFLYRVEKGEGSNKTRSLTAWELAARLSFWLWDSLPDDELRASAQSGALQKDPAVLAAQTDRLLKSPRARPPIIRFFAELLGTDILQGLAKDETKFPMYSNALNDAMRLQTEKLVESVVFDGGGDFKDLVLSRRAYLTADLAKLYKAPSPPAATGGFVDLPGNGQRQGILGNASVLALTANVKETIPTLRGVFVRKVLLCAPVPPPPMNLDTSLKETPGSGPQTTRQRFEVHGQQVCAACHRDLDPVGFGLEGFDAIGAERSTDNGLPVDSSGSLDDVKFDGLPTLAQAIANHADFVPCMLKNLYRNGLGAVPDDEDAELADVEALAAKAKSGWLQGLRQLAISPAFRTVSFGE